MNAFLRLFRLASAPALALDHFEATLRAHAGQWYSACLRITKDAALAEDAVQEAMLKAWDRRSQFQGQAELASWIYKIAVNCALDVLRRNRPALAFEVPESAASLAVESADADPLQHSAQLQWQGSFERALHKLTDLERVCFVFKHVESYSLDELASKLGCSISSVKQALFRATGKLRSQLTNPKRILP